MEQLNFTIIFIVWVCFQMKVLLILLTPMGVLAPRLHTMENAGFIVKCGICSLALEIRGAPKRGSYTGKLKKHIEEFI